jgi:hypothetical protein
METTGLHLSTHAEKETRYIQYGSLLLFQQYCILYIYQDQGEHTKHYITDAVTAVDLKWMTTTEAMFR